MLPIVDISLINKQTLYNSLGFGIAISQISKLNRIILVENHFEIFEVLYNTDFIDIIRELFPFINKTIDLNVSKLVEYLNTANTLINEHIYYVFLSNNQNIFNILTDFIIVNPYISMIFWNVFTVLE